MSATEPGGPSAHPSPIARLVALCARNPGLTLALLAALAVAAWGSLGRAPLDAVPDLSDVQVVVRTEWSGASPDLVESQVTWPVGNALLGAADVRTVRGISDFGVSTVYAVFDDGTDPDLARTRVLESLSALGDRLPAGARPVMGPDASGVGWVFQYALVDRSGAMDLGQLRALQDWDLRPALQSVPGVAEVAAFGGHGRQFLVEVDPLALRARGVSLDMVMMAVREASGEVGGHVLEIAGHEQMVRARGFVRAPEDLSVAAVGMGRDGTPVRVGDVARVVLAPTEQRGLGDLGGDGETVGAIVIMRSGENALATIRGVKERLAEVRAGLPPGVELVVTYDRSTLVEEAIDTLRGTLVEEMAVVSVVIVLSLLHLRSALVPILTLPLAVLLAFLPMEAQGLGANIMSLGGIAVAIGAMVDASVILVENVHTHLSRWQDRGRPGRREDVVVAAMQEVGPSVFFSLMLITVAFVPVFSLTGVEGRLFRPLAFTKTWSMAWGSVLAVTATPALVVLLVRGSVRSEEAHPLSRLLFALYAPVVRGVVRWKRLVVAGALAVLLGAVPLALSLGREFMPPLYEGAILYMPTAPPGMGAGPAAEVLQAMDARLQAFPEVLTVHGKMGRADTATDPAPLSMAEVTVVLRPRAEWRPGLDWEGLLAELDAALAVPGMPNLFWMPIQTRTEMLSTGVRSPVGVQVFGPDLATIEAAGQQLERLLQAVPGTRSASAERNTGAFYLDVSPRRAELARHGLSVADLQAVVQMGVGGMAIGETVIDRERLPVAVRFDRDSRADAERIAALPVATPDGAMVPLGQVAEVSYQEGPPMIRSEDGRLVGTVYVDPGAVPLADWVAAAKAAVAAGPALPAGVRLGWTGQFQYYERARETLQVALPATLFLVLLLLWLNTGSWIETAIVVLAVPFSVVGAVLLLWALDYNLSVAVWVGIIALVGLDAETGVVMLLYLNLAWKRRVEEGTLRSAADLEEVVVEGAARRLRPKLMTVATSFLGLVPILWSTGAGADVMRRIAAPMVGGLGTSLLLELLVYPAVYAWWKGRSLPPAA
jgi:copper/silver efflux system protein